MFVALSCLFTCKFLLLHTTIFALFPESLNPQTRSEAASGSRVNADVHLFTIGKDRKADSIEDSTVFQCVSLHAHLSQADLAWRLSDRRHEL